MKVRSVPAILSMLVCLWVRDLRAEHLAAILTGSQEVPAVNTSAFSFAFFAFTPGDGALIAFRINAGHTQSVTEVHIHEAPVGVNGPIILTLWPSTVGLCFDLAGGLITF